MLFLMGVLALLLTTPNANADDKEKYKLFAEETRKEVWALKLPEFTNTAVPDKYKDESAVILAAHSRLEITKKTRFNVGAFLGGFHYIDREVNCRDLYRMLVQINDKAALKEYSEFDYKAEIRKKDWRYDENYQQVLGVRIIKPDGTVNEVSTDEYMTATEGKKDQEQLQKLAVPGLEIGDKIDIFFFNYTSLENHNLDPFVFRFRQSHPMLSYTVHCEIDDKLTTQYRTLNGAPDFKQSKDENGNIVEVYAEYDPNTKSGMPEANRKVKGTLHWVSCNHCLKAEVRLYDRLWKVENPRDEMAAIREAKNCSALEAMQEMINPDSLKVLKECYVEKFLADAKPLDYLQFQRIGYFNVDKDSTPEHLVFNRTVSLKDTWSKINK